MASSTNVISNPTQFSQALLSANGWPQTPSNVAFLNAWQAREGQWGATGEYNAGADYNPLNTTLQYGGTNNPLPGTVGIQSYQSWGEGLLATSATLQNYQQVTGALQSGNAMQANNSGQLSSDLLRWSGGGYAAVGGSNPGATTTPAAAASSGATGASAAPATLMGDCYSYGTQKNSGKSSCLINLPGSFCFTACEGKAFVSVGLLTIGGLLMLVGTSLLLKSAVIGNLAKSAVSAIPGGSAVQNVVGGQYTRSRETRRAPSTVRTVPAVPKVPGPGRPSGQTPSRTRPSEGDAERENRAYMEGFFKASRPNRKPEGSRLNTSPVKGARYADVEGEF